MAFVDIRQEFVDGVQEIFTTLFNNGSEADGAYLYLLSEDRETSVYGEKKYKSYQPPKLLVCQAILRPSFGNPPAVTEIDCDAEFVVPLKSLQLNGLDVTEKALDEIRRGILKFHDVFYTIDNIIPKAFVEDVFLMYRFLCSEDKHKNDSVITVKENTIEEFSDLTVSEYSEDGDS